jgi:putative hydrolase of the HAD superfamily
MPAPAVPVGVETLLLDLDGTLLDLEYDNRFWYHVVPTAWAAREGVSLDRARELLAPRFRAVEHTLPWYSIDYWSAELALDIPALKRTSAPTIRWLPGAREFLVAQREVGRRLVLATNAHPVTLAIKDEAVGIAPYFDVLYSSHQFGAPKEDPRFWQGLFSAEGLDPARTLFIDDSLPVLAAARAAGIAHVLAIARPDSSRPGREMPGFEVIETIADLAP